MRWINPTFAFAAFIVLLLSFLRIFSSCRPEPKNNSAKGTSASTNPCTDCEADEIGNTFIYLDGSASNQGFIKADEDKSLAGLKYKDIVNSISKWGNTNPSFFVFDETIRPISYHGPADIKSDLFFGRTNKYENAFRKAVENIRTDNRNLAIILSDGIFSLTGGGLSEDMRREIENIGSSQLKVAKNECGKLYFSLVQFQVPYLGTYYYYGELTKNEKTRTEKNVRLKARNLFAFVIYRCEVSKSVQEELEMLGATMIQSISPTALEAGPVSKSYENPYKFKILASQNSPYNAAAIKEAIYLKNAKGEVPIELIEVKEKSEGNRKRWDCSVKIKAYKAQALPIQIMFKPSLAPYWLTLSYTPQIPIKDGIEQEKKKQQEKTSYFADFIKALNKAYSSEDNSIILKEIKQ